MSQHNYVHLSAGDLLRAERNRPGSELAQIIEKHILDGQIIPVAVTCSLIECAMNGEMQVSLKRGDGLFLWPTKFLFSIVPDLGRSSKE